MQTLRSRPIRAGAVAAAVILLGGCATPPPPAPAPAPAPDPIAARLQAAIVRVADLPEFTRAAGQGAPEPKIGVLVTASFQGEASQLLQRVAKARGKEFRVQGPKPHLPLVVHVDAVNVPYDDFLKDVGHQFGQRADLVLSDAAIEIRYRGQP